MFPQLCMCVVNNEGVKMQLHLICEYLNVLYEKVLALTLDLMSSYACYDSATTHVSNVNLLLRNYKQSRVQAGCTN